MKTVGKLVCISLYLLSVVCFLFGCGDRTEEKIGYFSGASFITDGVEYKPIEERENILYMKDKCLGISDDGEKYIYSVKNDDSKEFLLTADRGLIPGENYKLYASVDVSRTESDIPTAVYLADKYKTLYIYSDEELERHLSAIDSTESMISSYKYDEFSESEIRIYYCFDKRAVATVKAGVLVKTGAGWVYTPSEFLDDEKNGIVKGRIIADSDAVSYFESKMK